MKIRIGFVSNSSSSSFLTIYQVNYSEELKSFLKDEFGKYGLNVAEKYLSNGSEAKENFSRNYAYEEDEGIDIFENEKHYLFDVRLIWSNDEEDFKYNDSHWLADHLPTEYKKSIFEREI